MRMLLSSAIFWLVVLAVTGSGLCAIGLATVFGVGWGLLALGILCLAGSGVIRNGMSRA